ncbi:MAG: universal stress protein [Catalinimonas sp.]
MEAYAPPLAHRILIPVDFTDCAQNALRFACTLAEDTGADLLVLHVRTEETPEAALSERMEAFVRQALGGTTLTYRTEIRTGEVAKVVGEVATAAAADLIVMGTVGERKPPESFGSVTWQVMTHVDRPVLAVPEGSKPAHVGRVAFLSDLSQVEHPRSLMPLLRLVDMFNAELHVVNVKPRAAAMPPDKTRVAMELERDLEDIPHCFHVIEADDVVQAAGAFAERQTIDLLAVMPRKHDELDQQYAGRLTREMALHSTLPLLAFHEA